MNDKRWLKPGNSRIMVRVSRLAARLTGLGRLLGRTAYLMVGVPDYDVYVAHMRSRHPERPVMSYSEFFRERQEARYGGGKGRPVRCC